MKCERGPFPSVLNCGCNKNSNEQKGKERCHTLSSIVPKRSFSKNRPTKSCRQSTRSLNRPGYLRQTILRFGFIHISISSWEKAKKISFTFSETSWKVEAQNKKQIFPGRSSSD